MRKLHDKSSLSEKKCSAAFALCVVFGGESSLAVKSSAVHPANGRISHSLDLLSEVFVAYPVLSHLSVWSFSQCATNTVAWPLVNMSGCLSLLVSVELVPCFWAESVCVELCAGTLVGYVKIQVRLCWHLLRLYGLVVVCEDMMVEWWRTWLSVPSSIGGLR